MAKAKLSTTLNLHFPEPETYQGILVDMYPFTSEHILAQSKKRSAIMVN
jgi:hypothetical protein